MTFLRLVLATCVLLFSGFPAGAVRGPNDTSIYKQIDPRKERALVWICFDLRTGLEISSCPRDAQTARAR